MEIIVTSLTETHKKCPRCYRYVIELFPYKEGMTPICRRCCITMYDIEHGFVGNDYSSEDNQD